MTGLHQGPLDLVRVDAQVFSVTAVDDARIVSWPAKVAEFEDRKEEDSVVFGIVKSW